MRRELVGIATAAALMMAACHRKDASSRSAPAVKIVATSALPRGRWRLAPQKLGQVMLRVSRIVIGYAGSPGDPSAFIRKRSDGVPRPKRSRTEAEDLAKHVAEDLRVNPDGFAAAATRFSDDVATKPYGGTLGTVPAASLPPAGLDALATMKAGDVSPPFETPSGFQILKLEKTPPNEAVAASRIVITYAGSDTALRPGHDYGRTREEALTLAQRVAAEARQPGASFRALVDRYGDTADVEQGGDMGRWLTYEPRSISFLLEVIRRQTVGGTTDPIDTREGFQILQRTSGGPRELFAMSHLWFGFLTPDERSEAQKRLDPILGVLKHEPERFESFQETNCCKGVLTWSRGRAATREVQAAIETLSIGELSLEPVETAAAFYVIKRVQPVPEDEGHSGALVQLPAPTEPDLPGLLPQIGPDTIAATVQRLLAAVGELRFSKQEQQSVESSLRWVGQELSVVQPESRPRVLEMFWDRVKLPAPELKRLREFVTSQVASQMMEQD